MRRLLIAGAGKAALACIQQLSKLKHQFSMTVLRCVDTGVSAEPDQSWDEKALERLGVELHSEVCVEAIDRYARVVRGCDGSRTTFDTLVLAADSANPRLARAAGLEVRSGVVLNDFLQTSDAHVYALGEGAEHRGTIYGDRETIEEQARVLAAHLAGYHPAPFQGRLAPSVAGLANLSAAVKTSAASPASSSGSGPRSEAQTPDSEDQPALAGAV